VEEREEACDEKVLEEMDDKRQVYAEGILKVCEFCVESPLACVSGVTGADLKKRIVRIMSEQAVRKLDLGRKLLLMAVGLIAIVAPIVFGQANAAQGAAESRTQSTSATAFEYEVASIKPNKSSDIKSKFWFRRDGLSATGVNLQTLIGFAYGVQGFQISGVPDSLKSEKYDVEAKADRSVVDQLQKLNREQGRLAVQHMLQALLANRFRLSVHTETKDLPVYALVKLKTGPKFQEAKPGDAYPNGIKGPDGVGGAGMMRMDRGVLIGQGVPLETLVAQLSHQLGRTVVDQTGLTSKYDFTLQWTPDEGQGAMFKAAEGGPSGSNSAFTAESSGPSIFTALQEQLGLKLEPQKGPVEMIMVDHVERPSEN
jgi:uncharacterized protein (TIGR03435 family)